MSGPDGIGRSRRRTASEEVYQTLKRDLLRLRHRPGTPLREQELADRYGTSRVPVREACRRLQQEKLLESVPYKGYFVAPVSLREIADTYELRLVLETHAVRKAIQRATEGEIRHLEELSSVTYTYHDWDSYAEFLDRNLEYHVALAELSGNEMLASVVRDLLEGLNRYFFLGLDHGSFGAEMREEHEVLTGAIRERDAERAAGQVREQIERSRERIVQALTGRSP